DPPAAMRYCLSGQAMVQTGRGTVPIASLVAGVEPNSERDLDLDVLDRLGRPVSASKLFHSGDHPTLRLTTREGYEVDGTDHHPVLCLVDTAGVPMLLWKLLEEIEPGDRVVISRTPRAVEVELSDHDCDEAHLLGAFVSEGFVSTRRAGFNNV